MIALAGRGTTGLWVFVYSLSPLHSLRPLDNCATLQSWDLCFSFSFSLSCIYCWLNCALIREPTHGTFDNRINWLTLCSKAAIPIPDAAAVPARPMKCPEPMLLANNDAPTYRYNSKESIQAQSIDTSVKSQ